MMELLAANGADLDARDETQGTLLMHFARLGKAEPVQWLLASGARPQRSQQERQDGRDIWPKHATISRLLTS